MKQTIALPVIGLLLALLVLLPGASSAEAVYRDAGAASWPFLKMDIGARAAALGGTGLVNSGSLAIFANPALLAGQGASITASHNSWFGKTDQQVLSAVFPRGDRLAASLAFRILNTGGLEYRETPSSEPTGTFDVTDLSLGAAIGWRPVDSFAVGAGIKFIREKVWIEESSGLSFDAGILSTPARGLVLSAAIQNIGPGAVMVSREYRLPRTIRAGAGYTIPSPAGSFTVSAEVQKPIDNRPRGGAGLEYQPMAWVSLRGGYRFNDPSSTFTAGMGFSQLGWVLDYAYVPGSHSLGDTHRFTLTRTL